LAGALSAAQAERIDGIAYGEPDNLLLQRIQSVKNEAGWTDPTQDLEVLGKFGDGTFWLSDKSVRRDWQGQVILKLFKLYDRPKFLRNTNDPFRRQKRTPYDVTESIVALDCENKTYAVKTDALYDNSLGLVSTETYNPVFSAYKPGSVMELVQQKYCF
jgi:hypothetical protein